jgi:hypothetical protein
LNLGFSSSDWLGCEYADVKDGIVLGLAESEGGVKTVPLGIESIDAGVSPGCCMKKSKFSCMPLNSCENEPKLKSCRSIGASVMLRGKLCASNAIPGGAEVIADPCIA